MTGADHLTMINPKAPGLNNESMQTLDQFHNHRTGVLNIVPTTQKYGDDCREHSPRRSDKHFTAHVTSCWPGLIRGQSDDLELPIWWLPQSNVNRTIVRCRYTCYSGWLFRTHVTECVHRYEQHGTTGKKPSG